MVKKAEMVEMTMAEVAGELQEMIEMIVTTEMIGETIEEEVVMAEEDIEVEEVVVIMTENKMTKIIQNYSWED